MEEGKILPGATTFGEGKLLPGATTFREGKIMLGATTFKESNNFIGAITLEEGKILPGTLFDPPGIDKPNFCQQIETEVCLGGNYVVSVSSPENFWHPDC